MIRVAFDIDGTLIPEMSSGDKPYAKPFLHMKELINKLYESGKVFVCIYTARPWGDYRITKEWLDNNDIRHHLLLMGKFNFDLLIDDRATWNINDSLFTSMIDV